MKTLSENENNIIKFLFENNNIATQSKIRHNTRIPKSTLHRHISKLESKNIIKVQEFGKLKKAELTEFFLKD